MDQRVALRYAQALMDIAEQEGLLEKLSEDVDTIEQALEVSRELRAMLNSPVIRPHAKQTVLEQIFAPLVSQELMNFLTLLIRKGRGSLLPSIVVEFRKLVDRTNNVVRARIASAIELTAGERQAIEQKLASLTGRTVISSFTLEPSLKGGFVARFEDTQVDASLKHQLDILREQFRHGVSPALN